MDDICLSQLPPSPLTQGNTLNFLSMAAVGANVNLTFAGMDEFTFGWYKGGMGVEQRRKWTKFESDPETQAALLKDLHLHCLTWKAGGYSKVYHG